MTPLIDEFNGYFHPESPDPICPKYSEYVHLACKVFTIGFLGMEAALKRAEALAILTKCKPVLARQFGVTHLALFGSTVRDVARSESDIDILVAFHKPWGHTNHMVRSSNIASSNRLAGECYDSRPDP